MEKLKADACPNPYCGADVTNLVLHSISSVYTNFDTNFAQQLKCDRCGVRGPEAKSEFGAVKNWNRLPRVVEIKQPRATTSKHQLRRESEGEYVPSKRTRTNYPPCVNEYAPPKPSAPPKPGAPPKPNAPGGLKGFLDEYTRWDKIHQKVNNPIKTVKVVKQRQTIATPPVYTEEFPHICPLPGCGWPAYLADLKGFSECSNPDCDLS